MIKPLLPWRVRVALRRYRAARRRISYADVWPIDQSAGAPPPNWPGWPNGKRFAFVLTHDVEGSKGLSRIDRLMDVEKAHGFRSSFNFVPHGEYQLPDDLRSRIAAAGFETGVHGLKHDGKLYSSREAFAASAAGIREYARKWNAVGFRSPLMQHKLSWIHELGMEYDASTFDTDPFEPQSDAAGTIFPFWVPGARGRGYVELPYTLVQDFSLFIVLQESSIDIWKQKLDWIAERGGMVLLNTHPDYMCFGGAPQRDEFPVAHYEELLRYANTKYGNSFWKALPREVAQYYRDALPEPRRNTRKKICMLSYSNYECDNRVRRYAEALTSRGDMVDVIAVSSGDTTLGTDTLKGVTVHRIQRRDKNETTKWSYALRLIRFLYTSSRFLKRLHTINQYDLIHVHNIPDFLVFAARYPKSTGASVILDIHDIVPELYGSKFGTSGRLFTNLLKAVEKASATFSDHVIVSNHIWEQKLIARSVAASKCTTFVNHVDTAIFSPHPAQRRDGKFIILFPGSFQWHQGLDLAIQAIGRVRARVPNVEFHIYGGGHEANHLKELSARLNLEDSVRFCGSAPLDKMPQLIANSDMGVVPKRADSFGNEAFSTKIMEFMSQGVPVVVSRTLIDTFYYSESEVKFFNSGDIDSLAEAMLEVIENADLRKSLVQAGLDYVTRNSWAVKKTDYLSLVDSLTSESFSDLQLPATAPAISESNR
jgi:glycosyltransferase involved in cell wall biosynthesis/peptidoglycan/xylan/chitin deacetylase (PgdA/CDA1 family)